MVSKQECLAACRTGSVNGGPGGGRLAGTINSGQDNQQRVLVS
jgi:hypothetical protein